MKKQKGITLIALVITIIVLFILAGVTVATLTGDNGLLTKAGETKNATEQAKLEEEIQLVLIENETSKHTNTDSRILEKLKSIFEKSYGQGNIDVTKAGKNYKVKVKNTKTAFRIKANGTVDKYEEMDPTEVYARLDDDGTLYLRATQLEGYNLYNGSTSIKADWNKKNASTASVLNVIIEERIAPISTTNMFWRCSNLESIQNIDFLQTENVNGMHQMFYNCNNLKELSVEKFDTSNVKTMSAMFHGCNNITNIDVSGFNTDKVTDMNNMFTLCNKVETIDISNFNTSNVTNMSKMFYGCNNVKELDVTDFDTNKVTNMSNMFYGCNNIKELKVSNFKTDNVNNMSAMFQSCKNLTVIDVGRFNTEKVTDMNNMFTLCNKVETLDISKFNTNNVTNMNKMFYGCSNLKKLITFELDTKKVTDMGSMFWGCGKLTTLDLTNKFTINEGVNINDMFNKFVGITISAKQDVANKLKAKFTNFTDNNFEIIE